ncbi:MAG TPA: N-acetylmuramoyl-L-alanine amidase [Chitinophagaceae bacterium]|nr:N-acetylmuramoyl-L-alanine amidase [Chitinophagaceae bacterium]
MRRLMLMLPMVTFLSVLFISFGNLPDGPIKAYKVKQIKTIIVDAGHGRGMRGENSLSGAAGEYSYEDDICLKVSKKLVAELNELLPDVKVLETRPTEVFIDNRQRAVFANQNNGDLFISIHVNSAPKLRETKIIGRHKEVYYAYSGKGKKRKKIKKIRTVPTYKVTYYPNPANGTETFVFASHKTDDKTEFIAENGENFFNEKDDSTITTNINSPELQAQAALWTKKFFFNSIKLASLVEDEFKASGRESRGVKQRRKGIWVLQATAMPSILVETGFISHRPEEDYLNSENGQQEIAEAIARAVKSYKEQSENPAKVTEPQNTNQ